jgi:hypothetical protein
MKHLSSFALLTVLILSAEDKDGRMSWDETAALIGVYGTDGFFNTISGNIIVKTDGSNSWKNDPQGKQKYLVQKMPVSQMSMFIENRMMHIPLSKNKITVPSCLILFYRRFYLILLCNF